MKKISYFEALENHSIRQGYLNWLVESSGLEFPYVNKFQYITNNEATKIKDRIYRFDQSEIEKITAACAPNGEILTDSTIYFTENNFSENCRKILNSSLVSTKDFEAAQRLEVCYHEATHSEHFAKGIEGFNLDDFKIETEEGKKLFLITSELGAHTKHIQELGKTKNNSYYLRKYQRFLIEEFKSYMGLLQKLAKNRFDENLSRKIFDKYKELRYCGL